MNHELFTLFGYLWHPSCQKYANTQLRSTERNYISFLTFNVKNRYVIGFQIIYLLKGNIFRL